MFPLILGYSYDTDCIYINGTGASEYEFYIQLNRCGTLGGSDHNKKRDIKYKNTEPTVRRINFSKIISNEPESCLKFTSIHFHTIQHKISLLHQAR